MRASVVIGIMVAAGAATAGTPKPTADQAVKTATEWLDDITGAAPKTMLPLWSITTGDGLEGEGCGDETTKDAAALPKRLACLAKHIHSDELVPWTKKAASKLPQPLKRQKAKLAKLEKTATLVHHHQQCAGEGGDIIVAVALDKDTPKVVAVLYQALFCGE